MLIKCLGEGWSAEVLASDEATPDGLVHLQIRTLSETSDGALRSVKYLFQMFAGGRDSYVRAYPEVNLHRDFDTKETLYQGYARCAVQTTPEKQTDLTNQTAQLPLNAI